MIAFVRLFVLRMVSGIPGGKMGVPMLAWQSVIAFVRLVVLKMVSGVPGGKMGAQVLV